VLLSVAIPSLFWYLAGGVVLVGGAVLPLASMFYRNRISSGIHIS